MWELTGTDKSLTTFSPSTLLAQFIGKLQAQQNRYDHDLLIEEIGSSLPSNSYKEITMKDLIALGFKIGYTYRIFLEKNSVTTPQRPTEAPDQGTE